MRDGRARMILLTGISIGPAIVAALIVLVQTSKLSLPDGVYCRSNVETCLTDISDARSSALTWGWGGVLVVLALGIVLAAAARYLLRRGYSSDRPRRGAVPQNGRVEHDRALLVRACMEVSDRVDSEALRERLVDALADAGVTPVSAAPGEQFDSARHHAVGSVATAERERHDRVAMTQRPGYVDRGTRLRYPDVVVFNANGDGER